MTNTFTIHITRPDSVIIEEGRAFLEVSLEYDTADAAQDSLLIATNSTLDYVPGRNVYNYRILTSLTDPLARWTSRPLDYVSPLAIQRAEVQLGNNLRAQNRLLRLSRRHPAFQDMSAIANAKIRHYSSDFWYHDRVRIAEHPTRPFLWAVRNTGTWLIFPDHAGDVLLLESSLLPESHGDDRHAWYYYNGEYLNPIATDQIRTLTGLRPEVE